MFDKYTYKQKFIALLIVFIMLGITSYKRSFKGLFDVYSENKRLASLYDEMKNKSENLNLLTMQIANYDNYLGKQFLPEEIVQQEIVSFVAKEKGISINSLESIHSFEGETYFVYTNQLDVTGQMNDLLGLSYNFETKFDKSRVISTRLYTEKNNIKGKVVHLKVLFQNYKLKKENLN